MFVITFCQNFVIQKVKDKKLNFAENLWFEFGFLILNSKYPIKKFI